MATLKFLNKKVLSTARLNERFLINYCRYAHSNGSSIQEKFEEIQINVPWGHISGKWWGPRDVRPILGIHGWQDNAGTFDTLAPLLPKHIGLLAIDLPGHGYSSQLPEGMFYHRIDHIYLLKRIMKEYNWDKLSIMGHSLGSTIGFLASAILTNKVDSVIGFDTLKPTIHSNTDILKNIETRLESFAIADERNRNSSEPPSYTYEECIERLYEGTQKSVEKNKCHYILNRNLKKSAKYPEKYYFARDGRVKLYDFGTHSHELINEFASKICIPYLFIKFKQGPFYEDKKYCYETLEVMKKNPEFEFHEIDGTHHGHLNDPENVAEIINPFINKHKNSEC